MKRLLAVIAVLLTIFAVTGTTAQAAPDKPQPAVACTIDSTGTHFTVTDVPNGTYVVVFYPTGGVPYSSIFAYKAADYTADVPAAVTSIHYVDYRAKGPHVKLRVEGTVLCDDQRT